MRYLVSPPSWQGRVRERGRNLLRSGGRRLLAIMLAVLLMAACAPARPSPSGDGASAPTAPSGPKRIVVGVQTEINALATRMVRSGAGTRPGLTEIEQLVNAGLTQLDHANALAPELAEAVPSTANGLWKVFPDGRMETTWKIREGAVWQDGKPFTAEDLVFTVAAGQDPELPLLRNSSLALVEKASAPDPRTFVIEWKQPFIEADSIFAATTGVQHLPLPKHILEGPLTENKAVYETLPYWSTEFVGLGPWRLHEWTLGQSVVLRANDRFALGKPKIDEIELRSYPDPNVLEAAMLSEAVDLPLGTSRSTSFDMAQDLQARWSGKVSFSPGNVLSFWPQLLNPTPPIVGETRFRKGLVLSLNRQEMVNAFYAGNTQVADTFVSPEEPEFGEIRASAVQYPYDTRQAAEMFQSLGYTLGSDSIYRDASGQRLMMDLHSGPTDILQKAKLSAASQWQQAGVAVTPINDSDAQRSDVRYRATMTGFDTARFGAGTASFNFRNFRSSEARLPERGYVGLNTTGYINADLDALIERYYVTIPRPERTQVAAQLVQHLSDQVVPLLLFYDVTATAIGARLRNVSAKGNQLYNAINWEVP
jgi:peptide/nickel transport system substrate-binding protein